MTTEGDADALRALEARHTDELARLHAELARAQERAYWLDRWGLDLNALMRRRGAAELRLGLRGLRHVVRLAVSTKRSAQRLPSELQRRRTRLSGERAGAAESR